MSVIHSEGLRKIRFGAQENTRRRVGGAGPRPGAYSEALAQQEADAGLTASLRACGEVATGLGANSDDYLAAREGAGALHDAQAPTRERIMSAAQAGETIARGMENNTFLILTHPARRAELGRRREKLMADFDARSAPHLRPPGRLCGTGRRGPSRRAPKIRSPR